MNNTTTTKIVKETETFRYEHRLNKTVTIVDGGKPYVFEKGRTIKVGKNPVHYTEYFVHTGFNYDNVRKINGDNVDIYEITRKTVVTETEEKIIF